MYDIYLDTIEALGYDKEFEPEDLVGVEVDELPGMIAKLDSEDNQEAFFKECDHIQEVMEALGFEI